MFFTTLLESSTYFRSLVIEMSRDTTESTSFTRVLLMMRGGCGGGCFQMSKVILAVLLVLNSKLLPIHHTISSGTQFLSAVIIVGDEAQDSGFISAFHKFYSVDHWCIE